MVEVEGVVVWLCGAGGRGRGGVRKRGRADTGESIFFEEGLPLLGGFQVCGRMLHRLEQGVYRSSS